MLFRKELREGVRREEEPDLDREIEYAFEAEEMMGVRPPAGDVE